MVKVQRATIELWMHLRGLLSIQEVRFSLEQLLRFFRALMTTSACSRNSMVAPCVAPLPFLKSCVPISKRNFLYFNVQNVRLVQQRTQSQHHEVRFDRAVENCHQK